MTTTLNYSKLKENILNLLRSSDILSISQRGVTTATDNFTATSGQTDFVLSNAGVKNIRSVSVESVTQTLYTDYDINIVGKTSVESKTVSLVSGATLDDAVSITYDYGSGDKIYPDFPQDFITIKALPRIAFEIVSVSDTPMTLADSLIRKTGVIDFTILGFNENVEAIFQQVYDLMFANRKSLFYFNLLRPSGISSKTQIDNFNKNTLVFSKAFTFTFPLEFESD